MSLAFYQSHDEDLPLVLLTLKAPSRSPLNATIEPTTKEEKEDIFKVVTDKEIQKAKAKGAPTIVIRHNKPTTDLMTLGT